MPLPPAWTEGGDDHDAQMFDWLDNLPWPDNECKPYKMLSDCTTIIFQREEDAVAFKLRFRLNEPD